MIGNQEQKQSSSVFKKTKSKDAFVLLKSKDHEFLNFNCELTDNEEFFPRKQNSPIKVKGMMPRKSIKKNKRPRLQSNNYSQILQSFRPSIFDQLKRQKTLSNGIGLVLRFEQQMLESMKEIHSALEEDIREKFI